MVGIAAMARDRSRRNRGNGAGRTLLTYGKQSSAELLSEHHGWCGGRTRQSADFQRQQLLFVEPTSSSDGTQGRRSLIIRAH